MRKSPAASAKAPNHDGTSKNGVSGNKLKRKEEVGEDQKVPTPKKIKQEPIVSDGDDNEVRKRCVSDALSDFDSINGDMIEDEENGNDWQNELRNLVQDGEATLEDYPSDCETTLKWIVTQGIRLAITCTKCNIMDHAEDSQTIQEHGLTCKDNSIYDIEHQEFEVDIVNLPRPFYSDPSQLSLRKSLERNSSKLMDLPDEMKKLPVKFIMSRKGKKRAGLCTFCGDIFLSTDHKKWLHECWSQDNEVNGFSTNKRDVLALSVDGDSVKNPELLHQLLNKSLGSGNKGESSTENSPTKEGLNVDVKKYDHAWAYSIRDCLERGELKTKPMNSDPKYCIRYLINNEGVIFANICVNCYRIFSPSTNSFNRSRHISVCNLSIPKPIKKQEVSDSATPSTSSAPDSKRSRVTTALKNARSRRAYMLKKMDKDTSYNINLESLMSRTLSTDLLPIDVFYTSGMKTFFNKLLKIGFDLGQQPGTTLPSFEDFLPSRSVTKHNLTKFIGMDKFNGSFSYVSNSIQVSGGTIAIETIGKSTKDNKYMVASFLILDDDDLALKRLIVDVINCDNALIARNSINSLLDKAKITSNVCNLFVTAKAAGLLDWDKFDVKSSCFGDFLDKIVNGVFEQQSNGLFSEKHLQVLTNMKYILDKAPSCLRFLQTKCSFPSEIHAVLRSEFDPRWFTKAAWAQKLSMLLKHHSEPLLNGILNLDDTITGKKEIIELIDKAIQQTSHLQQYVDFVQIFIDCFEVCANPHCATSHLVVLQFKFICEQLKMAKDPQTVKEVNQFHQQLCCFALNSMELAEEGFLTKANFMATLLAPGHRNQLRNYYDADQIMNFKNELVQSIHSISATNNDMDEVTKPDDLDLELERYFGATANGFVDPLEWWNENEALAPKVAKFARRIFTIPAASVINDKTLPGYLSNVNIDEFLRRRVLFNLAANSEIQFNR